MASDEHRRIRATFGQASAPPPTILEEQHRDWKAAAAATPLLPATIVGFVAYDGVGALWVRPVDAAAGARVWLHGRSA